MIKAKVNRTDLFRWNSKIDLYEYFKKNYHLDQIVVDIEISNARAGFQLRKGRVINTKELWQKVGLNLEKRYGVIYSRAPIDVDLGIIDTVVFDDNDPNRTRRMPIVP